MPGSDRTGVGLPPEQVLERIAGALRHQIGPAVDEPFAKTQAFMAAVILDKLARQLRTAPAHARADGDDWAQLAHDLEAQLATAAPLRLQSAVAAVGAHGNGGDAPLAALVAALYAERDQLGDERFSALLTRVRRTLRARLDRQLEYAS